MSRSRASREVDLVVVGGGLAGLAAGVAAARRGASAVVLEAAGEPGGLARSFRVRGYTFDCSGHLLHLARPETRTLVAESTPPGAWAELGRRSAVVVRDRLVPYPFQLHLAHAPRDVRDECLAGLPRSEPELPTDPGALGLDAWISRTLGPGIGRHFMVPYNEKLATVPVGDLTCHALGRFVPRPSLDEIREGAASTRRVETGYNRRFLYPRAGGIDLLVRGLAARVERLRTGALVASIDTARRVVALRSGETVPYREGVISSAPLPLTAAAAAPAGAVSPLWSRLRSNRVTCVNVGLRRGPGRLAGLQWLYLPEPRFRAYRIGFYTGFTPAAAPPGRAAAYVEIAHRGAASERRLVAAALRDLAELGAIAGEDDVEVVAPVAVPHAYVIHDRDYAWVRARLLDDLERAGVHSVGRYGRWEYASMEDALWQGVEAVDAALAGRRLRAGESA